MRAVDESMENINEPPGQAGVESAVVNHRTVKTGPHGCIRCRIPRRRPVRDVDFIQTLRKRSA